MNPSHLNLDLGDRRRREPQLLLIGIDHRSAPLALREKVTYGDEEGDQLLSRLLADEAIAEACLLSTCNRTELYLRPHREEQAYRNGLEIAFLERAPEIEREGRFYVKHGGEVARHLLEVASGLQSMVLGEPEILGQVKKAAERATGNQAAGPLIQRLLRVAISCGGRARAETAITSGSVSFGYAVVDLARSIFRDLGSCRVLLLGVGEISMQVARALSEQGASQLSIANRTAERATSFAQRLGSAHTVAWDQRVAAAAQADVVVASTGANEPVLTRGDLESALGTGRRRPLLLVDLGVPRNIDPGAGELENAFLQDIDSLERLISQNLVRRRAEIPRVQEILDHELRLLEGWIRGLDAEPLVASLFRRAELLRRGEIETARERFPEHTHEELDRLTRALVRKLLHHPSQRMRKLEADDTSTLSLARHLFQLDDEKSESRKK